MGEYFLKTRDLRQRLLRRGAWNSGLATQMGTWPLLALYPKTPAGARAFPCGIFCGAVSHNRLRSEPVSLQEV